jgi:hypothetical protein
MFLSKKASSNNSSFVKTQTRFSSFSHQNNFLKTRFCLPNCLVFRKFTMAVSQPVSFAQKFVNFVNASPSPFHCVGTLIKLKLTVRHQQEHSGSTQI